MATNILLEGLCFVWMNQIIEDAIGRPRATTEKFQSRFYPNCISEWNKLDPEVRLSPSVTEFKTKLLSLIRTPAKSVFGIHEPIGLPYLSQIRVGLSLSTLNFHKFYHNFNTKPGRQRQSERQLIFFKGSIVSVYCF